MLLFILICTPKVMVVIKVLTGVSNCHTSVRQMTQNVQQDKTFNHLLTQETFGKYDQKSTGCFTFKSKYRLY